MIVLSKISKKGFSIIELLFVLVIISILVSFAIVMYKDYKNKAYVAKDGLLLAKNCMGDLVSYCVSNPGKVVNPDNITSCKQTTSVFGNVTFTVQAGVFNCLNTGELPDNYTIIVRSSITNKFYVKCVYYQDRHTYRCLVEPNF